MNDTFMNGSAHLMREWKTLRKSLDSSLSDLEHLSLVNEFWSKAGIQSRFLDWDSPEKWLDAWVLINSMDFDESSIALGMFYTLLLCEDQRWTPDRLKLMLIRDQQRSVQRIILEIDRQWLMNLDYRSIVEIETNTNGYMIQQKYSYDGKHHSLDNANFKK